MRNYKHPLSNAEQVNYIEENKNVVYNQYSKEKAIQYLYEHSYINVITPFKHRFAEKDKKTGIPLRDGLGNHIYTHKVDFKEYKTCYEKERFEYPAIYSNIMKFETIFNSIVAYECILYYQIDTYEQFKKFITSLRNNLNSLAINKEYNQAVISHMSDQIDDFLVDMGKYDDIYIFMDRLSLNGIITIFRTIDKKIRSKIFQYLNQSGNVFGYNTFDTFDQFLSRIVIIRNYVCHFNSLEVLIMYSDIPTKTLRDSSDRKKWNKTIHRLVS